MVSAALVAFAAGLWFVPESAWRLLPLGYADEAERQSNERPGDGVPVIVAAVGSARDDLVLEVVGTGRAKRSVVLRSEDAGRIVALALEANAEFQAGDVLMRLEDEEERLALSLAQTRLAEAERLRERISTLQGRGVAADARLDEVATAATIARLEVEQAREALANRVLTAPFDGVSGLPRVEVGDRIDSDMDIATYDDRSSLLVEFDIPETALARVQRGLSVDASTPAFPDRLFAGTVTAIDSRVDPDSRTAEVRVSIANSDDLLRPGGSFTIRLSLPGPRYPSVPELSVLFARGGLHVWRVADGRAEKVDVRLVRRRRGRVLVDGPLEVGDQVVVEGTQRLNTGTPVNVIGARAGETA